ncbi:uncharacterized protein LACBIDRAFT_318663 [Laccaria bicolor S238N-H82]|uniref:Predicted protein n=1 Tax=Laccaria bicolor (strain S238N-H82 / ATCC MYA-4686) TaxID=486041 RepID=B0D6Q8_LACBS|nr:uncharacterized protein LACBIDRAFT_318663 [Laccaria bicolor S238N-H82]EDR09519.1 predicted protein [Laccaria bicolor S238N-H82]|eukprot:XP_001879868.1 predicted protein [Laccaria bicolor S238N-H82]
MAENGFTIERNGTFYSILNVHKDASQAEINERHRALSLIFHPDRQQDEAAKETATREFLKIQKAYQVLSDPFLRLVYDTLGERGLAISWPEELQTKPTEEIRHTLTSTILELDRKQKRDLILPRGKVACSILAGSLFSADVGSASDKWTTSLSKRIRGVHFVPISVSHNVQKKINEKTSVGFEARATFTGNKAASPDYLGTVRHQWSPRIESVANLSFLYPHVTKVETTYRDEDNTLKVKGVVASNYHLVPPALTVSFSRKLFRSGPERGKITLHLGRKFPSLALMYLSPPSINLSTLVRQKQSLPSISGFQYRAIEKAFGISFMGILPKLSASAAVTFTELSTRIRVALEYGLEGLSWSFSAQWSGDAVGVSASTVIQATAILLQLDFSYLEQQLSLPIILSTEFNAFIAWGTIILPTACALLGHHFLIIPGRRLRRLAKIQAAHKIFEEDSDSRKERNAVENLLKDSAGRSARVERGKEGLVIEEAMYGAAEADEAARNLSLNVTTPVQALVRKSQLYIPGGTKVSDRNFDHPILIPFLIHTFCQSVLQGFSDPAPFTSKSLRVRYLFRGRIHYADIPDNVPVVLPLAEHELEKCT